MNVDLDYFTNNFLGYIKEDFLISFYEKKKVTSCSMCDGTGRFSKEELSDYHKREYETYYGDCKSCAGEGRLLNVEIYVSFGDIPYNLELNSSDTKNILFQTITKPYNKEDAKDAETYYEKKSFKFPIESVIVK